MTIDFDAFYETLNGYPPFPWQRRLAERVVAGGDEPDWPSMLDLPTGTGKTSAIDIALYRLLRRPDLAHRRIVLVVDRRIIVDQVSDHARRLRDNLARASGPVAEKVRRGFYDLFDAESGDEPFEVATLRGGMPRETEWVKRPDRPVIVSSTVDQVGSRLLFRGYGVSSGMAPIHAGLFGMDTLVLLDEVHLSEPFRQTLEQISDVPVGDGLERIRKLRVVKMSATAGDDDGEPFGLDGDDRAHPTLARRLTARKPTQLAKEVRVTGSEAEKRRKIGEAAAEKALAFAKAGKMVIGVVLNRVDSARAAHQRLAADGRVDSVLLTGRMRPLDRDRVVPEILSKAGAGRERDDGARPFVVVSTQTIEAGADLDFGALVTECASLDALVQRFGRLDRRGEENGEARAEILIRQDQASDSEKDPVYGGALARTWLALQALGEVDFGLDGTVAPLMSKPELLVGKQSAPTLLHEYLDEWVQTSIPNVHADPDEALWLHGPDKGAPELQVVWRSEATEWDQLRHTQPERAQERLQLGLLACPPGGAEALSLPVYAAKRWLEGQREEVGVSDTTAPGDEGDQTVRRVPRPRPVIRWDGERVEILEPPADARQAWLRPGDTLVVPTTYGGLFAENWDPSAEAVVSDLGDRAQLRRGRASMRLWPEALAGLGIDADPADPWASLTDEDDREQALEAWLQARLLASALPQETRVLVHCLLERWTAHQPVERRRILQGLYRGPVLAKARQRAEEELEAASSGPMLESEATTEDDGGSFNGAREVTLAAHSEDVETWARRFVDRLGLPEGIGRDVVLAGWLHDVGKADGRFQKWLVGGSEFRALTMEAPLAKSAASPRDPIVRRRARRLAGYPPGERHELLSLRMIEGSSVLDTAHDRELVLHLVASHHGWCRPSAPPVDYEDDRAVELEHRDETLRATMRHRAADPSCGTEDRFWNLNERYGPWGLAFLEALLRLADHRASEAATENRENANDG